VAGGWKKNCWGKGGTAPRGSEPLRENWKRYREGGGTDRVMGTEIGNRKVGETSGKQTVAITDMSLGAGGKNGAVRRPRS